jgi:hypothetical protein
MRNFYTLLLSGLLLCLTASLNGQTLGIGLTDVDGEVDETVCVDLVGTNFSGISGMQFSITFDTQILEFVSASGNINGNNVSMINRENAPNVVRVVYAPFSSTGYTDPGPFVIGQVCFRILQEVETDVVIGSSPTPLEFTDDMGNIFEDENDVNITNGTINSGVVSTANCSDGIMNGNETGIDCGGPDCPACVTDDRIGVRLTDAQGNVGETVCINLVGTNFVGISGMQFSITFDEAVLEFVSAMGNINGNNVSMINQANAPGLVRVVYAPFSSMGYTDAGPFVIGQLCFRILQSGETEVEIGSSPTPLEFTDEMGNIIEDENDVNITDGTINSGNAGSATCSDGIMNGNETDIDCGGPDCAPCMIAPTCSDGIMNGNETGVDCGGPDCAACPTSETCGAGSSNFNLCVGDACNIPANGNFCLDLTVSNFNNITGLQYIITYPAANLDFVSFTSPALGPPLQLNEFADGNLRAIYVDSDQSGETLDDGTVIMTICFTNETAGTTNVDFASVQVGDVNGMVPGAIGNAGSVNGAGCGGTMASCSDGIQNGNETGVDCGGPDCAACPTATCSDGIQNGNETGVDCGGPDCAPCMAETCGAGSSNFNLCVGDACNIPVNGNFCLDLTVSNFTNITGLQFRLEYPAANLNFTSFSSPSALGQALQFNENADGDLRAIYVDADQSGESLDDNTVIANICFTNETASATVIDVASLQVGNTGGMVVGPIGNDGSVNGAGCGVMETCNDGIQNNGETGVDCGGPNCAACPTMTECGEGTTDVEVCIGSVCGDAGAVVCVPVMVGNFDNLGGLQFSLEYAAGNLNYSSFTAHPSLQNGTTAGSSSDGVVTLVWNDPNLAGVSLDPTDLAFELCFEVENTMTTPLTFRDPGNTLRVFNTVGGRLPASGSPGAVNQNCGTMPTCSDGIMNGNETGVDCGGPDCAPCGGGMTGGDCGMDTDAFSICIGDACNVPLNGQACVDIFAGNFTDIIGFQMNVLYPGANLEFQSFTSTILGSELQGNNVSDGEFRLVFFNADLGGVSVADGASIGTICFTNETAGTTILDADNLRGSNTSGMFTVPAPIANDGMVNGCSAEPSCSNGIRDGNEVGIDCGGDCPNVCPTCDDGIMNGDETGVDCGGSCPSICPTGTTPTFSVGNGMAAVGEEVCIDVRVADFTNLANVAMTLNYDASALQLVSVTGNPGLPSLGASSFNTNTDGRVVVNYTPPSPQTLTNGQAFFTVCFTLLNGDPTNVNLTNISVTDAGGNTLMTNTNSGTVMGTVSFDNLTLVAGSNSGAQGTEVCVDITTFNLENLASLQFAISYNPEILEFVSGMGTGELPGLQIANPSSGILRAVWFDPNVGSNAVDDGNSIARVCFNVLQECETSIDITDDLPSFRIRAAGPDNVAVSPIDRVSGTVNAGATDCDGVGPAPNLVLQLGSASGLTGTEVCINLPATNFINLTSLSFSLNYDPTKVTFERATNFGLGSISAANVTSPGAGTVVFNWTSPSSSGESIADGNSVASFCFTVDRLSVTPVNFSNNPTAILARNGNNQAVGVVPSGGAINPDAPTTDGLTFQIGSVQAAIGDEICLPIIAFEAIDIVSFQYTINYDPTKLEYIGTGPDYAFPGFTNGSVVNSPAGVLRVAWADNLANGTTIPDGSAVYTICFRVLSTDLTLVTFGNAPTAIEFENEDDIIDDFTLLNGQVNGSTAPVIVSSSLRNPICAGGSDGSISLNVSGGPGLEYQWSPNVSNSETALGIPAGTYSVTITNGDATTEDSFTLTDPGPFAIEVASVSGVSCSGEQDGQITIATIGNNGPFTFDWSGSLQDGQGVNQQTNLDGDSYSVTVTDRNGCARILNNIMVAEPTPLNIAGSPFKITRDAPGGVTIEVSGGRAPFTYAWTGPNGYTSNAEDIDDVTEPGTYCLTVTDNNNCTDEQCFGIIRDIDITSTTIDQGCPGEDNGAIDITVIGGNGNYDYVWSSGGTTISNDQDLENLAPGDYQVMITSGECQITQTITVEAPEPILLPGAVTPATSGNNGTITLTPSGGNPPLSFAWDDGPTTQNRTNLTSGEYCVTATDESNCSVSMCYTVAAAAASILSVSTTPTSCPDSDDGRVVILINGGVAPFQIRIDPGTSATSADSDISLSLASGTYAIFITDAQGSMLDTMVTITSPQAITATTTITSDTEAAGCSGMISLDIAGGTGPYTVAWSDGETGMTRSLLCAGDYTPTITDDNGCTVEPGMVTVGRIDEELVGITEVACADGTEGGIDVTITGGAMPYTYAWTRVGAPNVLSTNEDLLASDVTGGVTTGDYTLTVMDATGASLMVNYTVGISAGFSVNTAVTSNYNGFGVSCAGSADGRIEIVISGQGDFMYEFLLNGAMVGMDSILTNAAAGTYTVTVIDAGGCEISNTVEVTAPPALVISETIDGISCGNTNDGSIFVVTTGGVGNYSYQWSTGAMTSRVSGLGTGTYDVTVTDGNNCVNTASYSLNAPEDLAITFEAIDATDGCNGSIRVIPLGGSGNYRFSFPQLPSQGNDPFAEGLCPGVYEIQVTDDNGCQTVTMTAEVLDRRFPCLSARDVITPNGDGLNEAFVITCSDGDEAINNSLQIFNRWGQLVYRVADYDCSDDDRGLNCFEGRTNDGTILPDGAYYYIFEFRNPLGEEMQQRGSLTILRD